MPFEKNQDCCHGSQIGYQNLMIQAILNFHVAPILPTKFGTGIAFMNVHVVLDSYRFITFLHLTPGVSPFSLLRLPKVDFMSDKKPNLETTSPKYC